MMRSRIRRDDGQVSLAVVAFALVVLVIGIGFMIFGQASDVRGKAQKAADAAALAAAKKSRDAWIDVWLPTLTTPVSDGAPASGPDGFWGRASTAGRDEATRYAAENDNASVDSFRVVGFGQIEVATVSEREDVEGTSGRLIGSLQGPGNATAEVIPTRGLRCTYENIKRVNSVPASWDVRCSGGGNTATASYLAAGLVPGDRTDFQRLFEIRLVD